MKHSVTSAVVAALLLLTFQVGELKAKDSYTYDDGFRAGLSMSYSGLHFSGDFSTLNNIYEFETGTQLSLLYSRPFSSAFALESGLVLFSQQHAIREERTAATGPDGQPTDETIVSFMSGRASTTHLAVPVNVVLRPLPLRNVYLKTGPEVSYKLMYSNARMNSLHLDAAGDLIEGFTYDYDNPEQSRDFHVAANLVVGYSFSGPLPLDVEFGVKQFITSYISDSDFATSRMRSFSFGLGWRF